MVKNRSLKNLFFIFLFFSIVLIPKNVFAQKITPSTIRVKNSDNSQVLADQSLDFFTNTPYYSTQIELPFNSPSLQYNSTYGIDIYMDFYVSYFNDWGNFGFDSPGVYILNNGLHSQSLTYNVFSNSFINVSNVVGYYRMHLSGTFATNSAGTLYIAFPFSHAIDLYGAKLISVDLNYYGSNTSNSDIIANNNQNTQNIIANNNQNTQAITNNNNQNTQNIINNNNSNTDKLLDDSLPSDTDDKLSDLTENDNLPSNVGIQDLITLPIRLYTSIVSSANTCEPVCFDLLDNDVCFPCFDIGSFFGTYWNIFDMLLCFVLLFKFATKLKEIFINITQLDENKGELIE